jgi:protein disulfide-isomerase
MTGNPIVPSRTSILETLPRVLAKPPKIPPKSTTSTIGTIFYSTRATFRRHPYLSWFTLVLFSIFAFVSARRLRRLRQRSWGAGGLLSLDGEKGLFGGLSSEKTD